MKIVGVKLEDSSGRTYLTVYGGRQKNRRVILHEDVTGKGPAEIKGIVIRLEADMLPPPQED